MRAARSGIDPLRLTVAYLRIWKLCDIQFYTHKDRDSGRAFDVIPIDAAGLELDLRKLQKHLDADSSWADDPAQLREDIRALISILERTSISADDLNLLEVLRTRAQKKALDYSGQIEISRTTAGF